MDEVSYISFDLDTATGQLFHVDDTVQDDVIAPGSLGITTYHINTSNRTKNNGYQSLHEIVKEIRSR